MKKFNIKITLFDSDFKSTYPYLYSYKTYIQYILY